MAQEPSWCFFLGGVEGLLWFGHKRIGSVFMSKISFFDTGGLFQEIPRNMEHEHSTSLSFSLEIEYFLQKGAGFSAVHCEQSIWPGSSWIHPEQGPWTASGLSSTKPRWFYLDASKCYKNTGDATSRLLCWFQSKNHSSKAFLVVIPRSDSL